MAKKTKITHRIPSQIAYDEPPMEPMSTQSPWKSRKGLALGVVIVGLVALFLTNKGMLLAAIVDGKPVFRWELNKVMTTRFGQQTLEQIISERLITQQAAKEGVSVTQEEIDAKVAEVTAGIGDSAQLDQLLTMQGMTRVEFENQIKLQLMIRNLLGRDVSVTEQDIDNYIATNRAMLVATEAAALREEARNAIFDSVVGEKLQVWFEELRQKSSIQRFL